MGKVGKHNRTDVRAKQYRLPLLGAFLAVLAYVDYLDRLGALPR